MTLAAAQELAIRLTAEVAKLRVEEETAKHDAAANKEHLVDGYWQARFLAERRLWAAQQLVEALSP